ncbi:MAG: calcium-binding protein, partial [Rhodoferax sp.]|nr:calcium-binding protein [Rhodoferax sp.]
PAGVDLNVNLDTVIASTLSYTLGAYLENLVQAGVSNATGTGNELANVLTGNDGDNLLNGLAGNDTINGGLGNDTVIGGQGNDSLVGGSGIDTADYSASTAGVTVELWRGLASADGLGGQDTVLGFEVVIGTAQNDLIAGSSIGDSLSGGAGNDGLYGGDGNDTLVAGLGQDTFDGGTGIDTLDYGAAAGPVTAELWRGAALNDGQGAIDTLASIDVLIGSAFNDILAGAAIGESFRGGAGNDGIYAGAGNDTLVGGLGNDTLDGGTNTDTVDYSAAAGPVVVSLLTSTATSDGDGGQDAVWNIESVIGTGFNDQLIGGLGADTLTGGAGNDTLAGGAGNDRLDGTSGVDTVTYAAATANVTAELWRGQALVDGQGGVDTLLNIDNLIGSNQNDLLAGTDLENLLNGGLGNDSLYAAGGADTLVGGAGNDILDGGAGTDVADYSGAAGPVTAELWRGATLADGSGGTDTFFNLENLIGSGQNDLLAGTDLANALSGGAGNDQLFGAGGADTLAGGLGNDTLNGGAGADLFLFDTAFGAGNVDTVQDFSVIDDTFQLENAIFSALLTPGTLAASQLRAGAGVTAAADADDFVLYNSSTGALFYDPDGNGAVVATQIATLGVGLALTAADFSVV